MSHPNDTGKEGLTELPKFRTQSRPQWESNPAGNVRSLFKANALVRKLVFGFFKRVKASQFFIVQAICGSDYIVEVFN